MKLKYKGFYLFFLSCVFASVLFAQEQGSKVLSLNQDFILGLTIDDSWYETVKLEAVVKALKDMKTKPTVRIVMSKDEPLSTYIPIFREISKVARILACPVDSYDMKSYKTISSYKKRFITAYETLGKYIHMWEIGNEINGEDWLGKNPKLIADKVTAAYDFIKSKGGITVLTAYAFAPGMQKISMLDWLKTYLPSRIKENVDYLLVSYYEDDNEGFQPDWEKVFADLEEVFPNSKLGIGECGSTDKNADEKAKLSMIRRYYGMPGYTKNFIGGFFWWYWVQDCVPHEGNALWEEINRQATKKGAF
ncbi:MULTISPECIES: hypothetical protein [unclassified Treponema]|uniref:hypothetical protein n=1 Tax=unclassified Treponema TaxID=2638727 RepID=UPI0020A35947|nr:MULTISPECIES: hypothetical protein [unclassified Treponema]UTC65897.1 hypothetical protein E4O06_07610 [Treponema sp. OMZ 789]UTC68625.1 hypothetical protein E4O01_07750 [Treponema sp. OMZ 790]UTC71355.1 hypothetical protein E4O02_07945 [Treponema sp. OMZ 791]